MTECNGWSCCKVDARITTMSKIRLMPIEVKSTYQTWTVKGEKYTAGEDFTSTTLSSVKNFTANVVPTNTKLLLDA